MELEQEPHFDQNSNPEPVQEVTSYSKYAVIALLIILPLLGAYVGYTYAPEKIVEVEKVADKESEALAENNLREDWKTYTNQELGITFKYPTQINGKPVSITERKDYGDFLLFQSKIPYESPYGGKAGEPAESHFSHHITFSAIDLTDFSYPASQGKVYAPTLTVGVDLGGQGGYIYDPAKNKWHLRDNPQQELTWEEMYNYFGNNLPDGLTVVKTASGFSAFPYSGSAYENYWTGYRIFNTNDRLYVNFHHSDSYIPESIRSEVEKEDKAIREFLQGVVETVEFF